MLLLSVSICDEDVCSDLSFATDRLCHLGEIIYPSNPSFTQLGNLPQSVVMI